MEHKNTPLNTDLPSMGKLIKSTVLAIVLATIILVTVVLPAEYGLDPTGIGNFIGLVKMGEIKMSLAQEAAADRADGKTKGPNPTDEATLVSKSESETAATQSRQSENKLRSDEITFSLSPGEGKEIKLTMTKGAQVNYVWQTDGGRANFDAHADSKKLQIRYHSYNKGSVERKAGVLEAAFDGKHGWFWRNRTTENMQIILQVEGEYSEIKQLI